MMDMVKEYWGVISMFLVTVVWGGRLAQRVSSLEKEEYMRKSECGNQMKSCQRFQESEFAHGANEFSALKEMIEDTNNTVEDKYSKLDRKMQDRHDCVMKILLDLRKG